MSAVLLGLALLIGLLIAANLHRVAVGPTAFDRLLAAGVIGTNSVILLVVIGGIFGRVEMFLDLAIAYALLNLAGVVAVGKFLEPREDEP